MATKPKMDMKMERKELQFMKKKGAPKAMIRHEEQEMKQERKVFRGSKSKKA